MSTMTKIFDSTRIFEYFEHLKPPPLWPAAPAARAHARLLEQGDCFAGVYPRADTAFFMVQARERA